MTNTKADPQQWITLLLAQKLPFIETLSKQIAVGQVGELCKCGCQSFAFELPANANVEPLQKGSGLFHELAFTSNFPEEVNMLLFTDERGGVCRLDVTYSPYSAPFPEGLVPGAIIGAWPAARK